MKRVKAFANNSVPLQGALQNAGRIHFGPLDRWINDPTGLVYCEGVYHLFYQLNPNGREWGNMHWGHAVSSNLVQWQQRPIAIAPHPELGMAFTGSVVVDSTNTSGLFPRSSTGFVAFLTTALPSDDGDHLVQTQSIALSHDQGETWEWYPRNPVIPNGGRRDFRDPKVFRHRESNRWIACISCGDEICFYGSKDLLEWGHLSSYQIDAVPDVCECPDLIRFPDQPRDTWVLMYSLAHDPDGHGAGVRYAVGEFDGLRFIAGSAGERKLDFGSDFYAAQSWYALPAGADPIVVAWANNSAYSHKLPELRKELTGMMTLPRRLSLVDGVDGPALRQQTVTSSIPHDHRAALPAITTEGETRFSSIRGAFPFQLEIRERTDGADRADRADRAVSVVISLESGSASRLEGPAYLRCSYDRAAETLTVTREPDTESELEPLRRTDRIDTRGFEGPFELLLFIEKGIAEFFLFGGRAVATYQWVSAVDDLQLRISGNTGALQISGETIRLPREEKGGDV